jgi:acyl dehydratase
MPVDPAKALGHVLPEATGEWDQDNVILYHLGVGAGVPATDPNELAYTYEGNLKVLPSYGVIPVSGALGSMAGIPGVDINFALVLHGEQDLEIKKTIPTQAKVVHKARIADIFDKGKAALIILEVETAEEGGDVLFVNRFSIFARGEGGFGGESGPKAGNQAPDRAPDYRTESTTMPQQALLYRLNGDKNPLHADPEFAKMGGFDTPILHGLCSYGIVCKAVVDTVFGGDTTKVGRYQVRFAGVVFPGETIVTSMWKEGDKILVEAKTKERETPVITNAAITIRD